MVKLAFDIVLTGLAEAEFSKRYWAIGATVGQVSCVPKQEDLGGETSELGGSRSGLLSTPNSACQWSRSYVNIGAQ